MEKKGHNSIEGTYEKPIILSRLTEKEAISQVLELSPDANREILARQKLIEVKYLSHDKKVYKSQIMIDKELAGDILSLFDYIETMNRFAKTDKEKFFIGKINLITDSKYKGDDILSMKDNNTSAFNYRVVAGTNRLSLHAFGFAFDLNPRENPIFYEDGTKEPKNGVFDKNNPNTLVPGQLRDYEKVLDNYNKTGSVDSPRVPTPGEKIVNFLKTKGFEHGGSWDNPKDYHHFEKVIPTKEYVDQYLNSVITNPNITKKDVVKRAELFIVNNSFGSTYTNEILRFLKNEKVREIIGKEDIEHYTRILEGNLFNNEKVRS